LPSSEPTNTVPFTTAGDEKTEPPVRALHFITSLPVSVLSLLFHPSRERELRNIGQLTKVTPVPLRAMLADTPSPLAVSAALSTPLVVGAYLTVTLHDFPGPRADAVQLACVDVNAADPESETVNVPVEEPPELVSVNV
jgi:hypothetical protein